MVTVHAHDTGPMWPRMALLRTLADNRWWILLRGIVAIAFGVTAFIWPTITLIALTVVWGTFAIADGLFALAAAVADGNHDATSRWWLGITGIVSLLAGVVAFVWPGMTTWILLLIIASWAIAAGILEIWAAIYLRREIEGEWLLGLAGLLSVILGAVLFVQPGAGALALVWVIATFAILIGLNLVGLAIRLQRFSRAA